MVIQVRDKDRKLRVKDILDIDFDMYVENIPDGENGTCYRIRLNQSYEYAKDYETEASAEADMEWLAESRNNLEEELRSSW